MKMHQEIRVLAVLAAAVLGGPFAQGADGTWNVDSSGNWNTSTTSSWLDGIVAEGASSTASFTNNITTGRTVTLTEPMTIGTVIFGDSDTSSAGSWTLTGSATNKLTLAGAATITVNALGTNSLASISAVIDGTSGLTKNGTGILALSGANTYSGATTVSAGTLRIGSSSALGTSTVTVASGATLQLQNSLTVGNSINLNGSSALANISGTTTVSGTVTLQSASTVTMTAGSLNLSGAVAMGSNTLTVAGASTLTLSGSVSGSGTLSLTGAGGTTIISGDNSGTFSGEIQVNRNTLGVGHDGALGTGTVRLGVNDQMSGIRSTDTTARTIANTITLTGTGGTGNVFRFGSSTADLNGDLTFTSTTAIALSNVQRRFEVFNRTEFDAAFTGTGSLTLQTGTGTLVLNGTNTYTGATTINAGTLQLGNGGTTGKLSTSSTITNNGNLTINRSNAVVQGTDFSGNAISGTGSFTQAGSGTTTLTAANTYTGATNVNAGTLLVNGSLSASSAVAVNSGGTLGGGGTVGAVTVASGGSLAPGSSIGSFSTSSVDLQNGSILKLELNTGAGTADSLNVTGAFNLATTNDSVLQLSLLGTDVAIGQVFTLVDYGTWNGGLFTYQGNVLADDSFFTLGLNQYQISYNGTDGATSAITLTAVPEPSTYALLAAGGLALYVLRRKKQGRV